MLGAHLPIPEILAVLERGQVFATYSGSAVRDVPGLLARSESPGGVILKPNTGRKGNGVQRLQVSRRGTSLDGQLLSESAFKSKLADLDAYLVVASVTQANCAEQIYPGAANSLRVLTLQDPTAEDRPFVAVAGHRFGALGMGATDNLSRGGLHAHVDPEGTLGPASKVPETGSKLVWHSHHPDTGGRIEGVRVPGFVRQRVLDTVTLFPFLHYVGWDVVVAPGGSGCSRVMAYRR